MSSRACVALLLLSGCQALVGINDLHETNQGPDAGNTGWTIRRVNPFIHDVIYAGGQFVGVGGLGLIETSPDGIAWTPRVSNTNFEIYWGSTDGQTWAQTTDIPRTRLPIIRAFSHSPTAHWTAAVGDYEAIVTLP